MKLCKFQLSPTLKGAGTDSELEEMVVDANDAQGKELSTSI